MSKKVITTKKIINSYEILKSSKGYNENSENARNDIEESIAQNRISREGIEKNTDQRVTNAAQIRETNNTTDAAQSQVNNYDTSSLQQRSVYSHNRCTCGKWGTDTNKTYVTSEYCTCDDAKDGSVGCTCYKRNTNKTTFNKTMSSNDQNIFIQEGNSSDYCNCDCGREERQIFSNANSDYNLNVRNVLTDEDMNMCTCGQKTTLQSSDYKDYNKNQRQGTTTSNVVTRIKKIERKEYSNPNNMNNVHYSTNIVTTSYNEIPMQTTIQTTDYEDKEVNVVNKSVIEEKEKIIIREKIREQVRREFAEEIENVEALWSGDNYIQVIERLQYLSAEPPELRVQFLNDLMINRTIDREPINILIPIPDNYIQKQGVFEVISEKKEKKEEEKDLNEDLCPENVDLLNISHAYSIPVPSFNNLEIENDDMFIAGIPKPEEKPVDYTIEASSLYYKGNEVEPFVIENYAWDINPSERSWTGDMRAVRINKLGIESNKRDWNALVDAELASQLDLEATVIEKKPKKEKKAKKEKKEKKIKKKVIKVVEQEPEEDEDSQEEEVEEIEQVEEVEEVDKEAEKEKERRKKEKEKKKKRKDQKYFKTRKFHITYKENRKKFKTIDIGDNEVITLRAIKTVLQPGRPTRVLELSDKTDFKLGGNGFDANKYKWAPVPVNAQSMSIEKTKIEIPLENISTDKMEVPAARRRKQDWNLINNLSSESTVNILTKEKILSEQTIRPVTVLGEPVNKNKWNDKIRKQKGIKLGFPSTKKWVLNICKEIDILYEQDADDVIINDDYNNVKGPEMRPITATIIKVNEEDETSSVSSYDVFQNLIVKKIEYDNGNIEKEIKILKNRSSYRNIDKDKNNKFKLRVPNENDQKNKNDKPANQPNLGKKKNIEFIREDPEPKNYLRV